MELAAGNVVNGYLPATWRLVGGKLEQVPPEGSSPSERGMRLVFGPSSFLADGGRMDPVRTLIGPDSFAIQAPRVRGGWLWLKSSEAGLSVAGDPKALPPVVASGWLPTNPWVAAGPVQRAAPWWSTSGVTGGRRFSARPAGRSPSQRPLGAPGRGGRVAPEPSSAGPRSDAWELRHQR